MVQPGLSRGRSSVRIHNLIVVNRLARIVQLRQRPLGLAVLVRNLVGFGIGVGFYLGGCLRLLEDLEFLLKACQFVFRCRFLLLPVLVAFHVLFQLLDFFIDLRHCLGLDGLLVAFLCPFLFVAVEFLLPGLLVMILHRIGIAAALVAARHDSGGGSGTS